MVEIPEKEDSKNHNNIDEKNLKIHYVPEDQRTPPADNEKGEPEYEDVNNPRSLSSFHMIQFLKGKKMEKKYKYHCHPTGCVPVLKNKDGKRIFEGWKFFYNSWNPLTINYDDDDTYLN